jgi:hypothetical protein
MEVNMFYPQGSFGNPQGAFGQHGASGQQSFQGTSNGIPFANTLYGYPPQLGVQPFALQHQPGANALSGLASGAAQSVGARQQPQANPEQINPALTQQSQQHLLQRLAQYHYLVAQQLAQLAAQQAAQNTRNHYAGRAVGLSGGTLRFAQTALIRSPIKVRSFATAWPRTPRRFFAAP